jgi:excisionase family DNA binding protein
MAKRIALDELMTPLQVSKLRGVSKAAVYKLMQRGKLPFIEVAGRRLLRAQDVLSFKPDKGGRPPTKKTVAKLRSSRGT